MSDLINAFKFFSDHIHILGWLTLISFVAKMSWRVSAFLEKISQSFDKTTKMQNTVEKVATNHLPHLQQSMDRMNETLAETRNDLVSELKGVRGDLFQIAIKKD